MRYIVLILVLFVALQGVGQVEEEFYGDSLLRKRITYLQGDSVKETIGYGIEPYYKHYQEYWSPDSLHIYWWRINGNLMSENSTWNCSEDTFDYRDIYYDQEGNFHGAEEGKMKTYPQPYGGIRIKRFEIDQKGVVIKELETYEPDKQDE